VRLKSLKAKLLTLLTLSSLNVAFANLDASQDNTEGKWVIGAEFGVEEPVKHKFIHKDSKTKMTLKRSAVFTGALGYGFYPGMVAEFSATHQPSYDLGYVLPEKTPVPSTKGKTKVSFNAYILSLSMDLTEIGSGVTPFLIGGVGIANLKVKATNSKFNGIEIFKMHKYTYNRPIYQLGLGVAKDLSPTVSVQGAAKLQVIPDIRIKYSTLDIATMRFNQSKIIKKTVGTAEFVVGFRYKLPI
jgi:hypothetical protein